MKALFSQITVLLMSAICQLSMAVTVDTATEAQISAQLGKLPNTQVLQLQAGEQNFPALFSPAIGAEPRGAVILLHDLGQHMNWPQVIAPLRHSLPDNGWATLSLQMPILPASLDETAYGRTIELAAQRIQAGYDYLQPLNLPAIAIVGHGLGAGTALWYIGQQQETPLLAVVAISMDDGQWLLPPLALNEALSRIRIPLLDLYAGNDRVRVRGALAERRATVLKNPDNQYRVIKVPGAGPDYSGGYEAALVRRIRGWLNAVVNTEASK